MSKPRWKELEHFTACDIADALLKLHIPGAGFLPDILPLPHHPSGSTNPKRVVAPASTFLMVPKRTESFPNPAPRPATANCLSNIPDNTPYADLTVPETIVLISQPSGQSCAVVGGIMATQMQELGAQAIIVDGRVRDLNTLSILEVPIWSKGTSIVGAGAETKCYAQNVEIKIGETNVMPGDIVMVDEMERGVVVVPWEIYDEVLDMLPRLVNADELVLQAVEGGGSVKEAFAKYRS